jgi:glycosyltransferase involved in cell wall biosynthesis
MRRIAFVITELDVGGAERQLVNLATGLDRRFFKSRVYALGGAPPAGKDELVQRLHQAEVPIELLNARGWWQFGPTVEQLAARLREFQPHVMQSFLFHANVIGALAARSAKVPAVSLGIRVNDPRWWRGMLERRIARRADRVVCVSQSVSVAAQRRLRLREEQCVVIPNGIDVDRFEFTAPMDLGRFGVPPGVKPIVFVGRLDRQKGAERLVDLVPALETFGHHLLIVGSGPLERRLRTIMGHQKGSERVHFAGWQAEIPSILAACSLLVLPSRYEGMPNVVLEAMAAGLPVLTTPADGVLEIMGDKKGSGVFRGKNPSLWTRLFRERLPTPSLSPLADGQVLAYSSSWIAAMLTALDPEVAQARGELNRQRVREHFSLTAMVQQYERLFSGLISA